MVPAQQPRVTPAAGLPPSGSSLSADAGVAVACGGGVTPGTCFPGTALCESDAPMALAEPVPAAYCDSDPPGNCEVALEDVRLGSSARLVSFKILFSLW